MQNQNMRYISEVPAGWIVRKTVNGQLFQSFFGETRYGSKEKALSAAIEFRDSLLKETAGARSFQHSNTRNITGIIGVAWHCRPNTHRKGNIVHSFRAQVAGDQGKPQSKAWAVQRYGLWGAYENAARWRHMMAFGKAIEQEELVAKFVSFLRNYIAQLTDEQTGVQAEMRNALMVLAMDPDVPSEAHKILPHSIQRRCKPMGNRKSPSGERKAVSAESSESLNKGDLDLYDTDRVSIL